MVRVTPIKLQAGTRVLWFDPAEHTVCAGDHVIVSTERGSEFGVATADIMEVSDEMIAQLKSPLKPVLRIADEADIERADELRQKGEEALSTFKELAAETNEQMRPVMVEFLFDGDKAVFYFESEERIDFRDLVRKLASVFHVRVDMRQIGVRRRRAHDWRLRPLRSRIMLRSHGRRIFTRFYSHGKGTELIA